MAEATVSDTAAVLARVRRFSFGAYLLFIIPVAINSGWPGFVGLTCSAVVTMISFLWLEQIVGSVLQPSPRLRAWKVVLRTLMRYAFLGAALAVTIIVARLNAVSVLLGFSIVVVGIIGEAVYSTVKGFAD